MTEILEAAQREFGDPDHAAREWAESLEGYHMGVAAKRRRAWIAHHTWMERLHARLADEHDEKAAQLSDVGRET